MALFRNREKRTIAQLEDYYASRNNNSKAWAMAFLSLFLTVVVLSGLFYGGRWAYRALTDDETTLIVSDTSTQVEEANQPASSSDNVAQDQSGLEIISVESVESESADVTVGTVSDEAASTSTPNVSVSQTAGASTDVSSRVIPNTGTGEVLIILPILTAVAGYTLSRRRQINNS